MTDLRTELRNQAADRPDPAGLVAALSRRRTIRRSRFAAGGLAAAVVVIMAVGAALSGRSTPPASLRTTSTAATALSSTAGSTFELVCDDPIAATTSPDASLTAVLGVTAVNTQFQGLNPNVQHLGPGELPDPAQRYFLKSGLQIKVGQAFHIEVPPAWRGRVEIGWSNISVTPAAILAVPACPRAPSADNGAAGVAVDQWLTYPGGIWVSAPACVPLQVITATATETIHIAAGKSCT